MKQDYSDITDRLGDPLWWDEAGCPRYIAFHPSLASDFYAQEAALLHVGCQACSAEFRVCVTSGRRDGRLFPVRPQPLAYGDPPRHNCQQGAAMTTETLDVLELWVFHNGIWQAEDRQRYLSPEVRQRAKAALKDQHLKMLKLLLMPKSQTAHLAAHVPGLLEIKKKSDLLKEFARLGATPQRLAELEGFQLEKILEELERECGLREI